MTFCDSPRVADGVPLRRTRLAVGFGSFLLRPQLDIKGTKRRAPSAEPRGTPWDRGGAVVDTDELLDPHADKTGGV